MKTLCRLILGFITLLSFFVSTYAADWRTFDLRLNPGRAGHSFSLEGPSGSDAVNAGLQLDLGTSSEAFTHLQLWLDFEQPLTLIDNTVGDRLDWLASGGADFRLASWHWQMDNDGHENFSGQQFLLVGGSRASHSFLLGQGSFFSVAHVGGAVATPGFLAGGQRYEVTSWAADMPWWVIDLNTNERSATGALDLALTSWFPYNQPLPVADAWFYLDAAEAGHTFTLHSRAGQYGAEQQQSLTAQPLVVQIGSAQNGWMDAENYYSEDHAGTALIIPAGTAAYVRAPLGIGMSFWLTRDGDGAATPVQSAEYVSYPQWTYFGNYAPLPPPPIQFSVRFCLHTSAAPNSVDQFSSWYYVDDGNGGVLGGSLTGMVDSTGTLYSYDDFGVQNGSVIYVQAHFELPANASLFALFDGYSGHSLYGNPADFAGASFDFVDWQPTHAQPPEVSPNQLSLTIFGGRKDHVFSVCQPGHDTVANSVAKFSPAEEWVSVNGNTMSTHYSGWATVSLLNDYGASISVNVGGYSGSSIYSDDTGEWLHLYDVCQFTVPYDSNQPYWIVDETTGEIAAQGQSALGQWFTAPVTRLLAISSSRWGHDLWLAHSDGSAVPVIQHATQGDYSLTDNGTAWWNSYFWFDATAASREDFAWRLEDRDAYEATPFYPGDQTPSFIGWIALANPETLTAEENADGSFSLAWNFAESSTEGAFKIERRENAGGAWVIVATVPANGSLNTSTHIAHADAVEASRSGTASVRVFYEYGGHRSLASNAVDLQGLTSDSGGIPNWWRSNWFGTTALGALRGAGDDFDHDGMTNFVEWQRGTNPTRTTVTNPTQAAAQVGLLVFTPFD